MTLQAPVPPPGAEPDAAEEPKADLRDPSSWLPSVKVTVGAFALALVIGAFVIAFSDDDVIESLSYFGSYPWDFFTRSADAIFSSYWALVKGSVGSANALGSTLTRSAPLICAGLGVTLAFRAGLFNIGAQGQLIIAAICAGYVGFTWNLPPFVHLVVALVAGAGRRRLLGRARRLPQGPHRCPRGDHDDHVQLPRGVGADLRAQPRHLPAPGQRQRALAAGGRLRDVPDAQHRQLRPAPRRAAGLRRRRRGLVAARAQHLGLRAPGRRRQRRTPRAPRA